MSTETLDTVQAFLDAFAGMDVDAALRLLSDDCEYTNVPIGTVTGPDAVRAVLEPFSEGILENEFQILRRATNGQVVFLERLDRHRLEHGWRELPVNSVFEVREGRIAVWRDYFDLATMARIHDPAALSNLPSEAQVTRTPDGGGTT